MLVGAGERARGRCVSITPLTTSYTLSLALGSPVEKVPWWVTTDRGFHREEQRCWFVGGYVGVPSPPR